MLDELLTNNRSAIVKKLVSALGVGEGPAGSFFDKAISMIQGLVGSGTLDVQTLLKGDISALTSSLDLAGLGQTLGGGEDAATKGLGVLVDEARSAMGDDASGLLKSVGGLKGAMGRMFG